MSNYECDTIIAIPCLNEEQHIGPLLENLLEQANHLKMKIIVADGGSSDNTRKIVSEISEKRSEVILLDNPKKIQSAGVNLAVQKYGHLAEFFIRIDAHATYPLDFCQTLLNEAKTKSADSVVVSMFTEGKDKFQQIIAETQNSKLGNGGSSHRLVGNEGKWVEHGHHALMSVSAYLEVGGYDEDFPQNQDAELDLRLAKAGYKIWLTGATSMTYYPRSTLTTLYKQYYRFGKGRVKTLLKHKVKPKLRQLLPVFVFPAALLAVLSSFSIILAVPILAYIGLCLLGGIVISIQHKKVPSLLTGPIAIVMHFAWSLGFWVGLCKGYKQPIKSAEA